MDDPTRAGFVALIGAPNAGKSTLMNRLVGAKVSIVTHKVQTTRTRVLGIVIQRASQLIFVDTPGIFEPKRRLDRAMVRAAWDGAQEADAIVLLADARRGLDEKTLTIIDGLKQSGRKAILAINKIDTVKKEDLLEVASLFDATGVFAEVFMISATRGDGTDDLLDHLAGQVPEGPWLFPEDQLSDMPQRLMAAEVTREKLYLNVHQEVPYELTVETEQWKTLRDGSVRIEQTIYVRRDSQKAIILGKGGRLVKRVGQAAREELSRLFGVPVQLYLFVKVREKWAEDPARYSEWNLDFKA